MFDFVCAERLPDGGMRPCRSPGHQKDGCAGVKPGAIRRPWHPLGEREAPSLP